MLQAMLRARLKFTLNKDIVTSTAECSRWNYYHFPTGQIRYYMADRAKWPDQ